MPSRTHTKFQRDRDKSSQTSLSHPTLLPLLLPTLPPYTLPPYTLPPYPTPTPHTHIMEYKNITQYLKTLGKERVSVRCKKLNAYINSILDSRDQLSAFFTHLPALMVAVFGDHDTPTSAPSASSSASSSSPSSRVSWVEDATKDSDAQALIKFLSPDAPLFTALLHASLRSQSSSAGILFPTSRLPGPTQHMLRSRAQTSPLPLPYRDHRFHRGGAWIELSVLEYYFFCFAYFVSSASNSSIASAQDDGKSSLRMLGISLSAKTGSSAAARKTVYSSLAAQYIRSFYYIEPSAPSPWLQVRMGNEGSGPPHGGGRAGPGPSGLGGGTGDNTPLRSLRFSALSAQARSALDSSSSLSSRGGMTSLRASKGRGGRNGSGSGSGFGLGSFLSMMGASDDPSSGSSAGSSSSSSKASKKRGASRLRASIKGRGGRSSSLASRVGMVKDSGGPMRFLGFAMGNDTAAEELAAHPAQAPHILRKTSDTIARVFVDFWLNQNTTAAASGAADYIIPSIESLQAILRMVEHVIPIRPPAIVNGYGGTLYGSRAASGVGVGMGGGPGGSDMGLAPGVVLLQKPVYIFLRMALTRINFDGAVSLRDVVDIWLAYVTPWEAYSDLKKDGALDLNDFSPWASFVQHNFLFYTVLFRQILELACNARHVEILQDVLGVFEKEHLLDFLKDLERIRNGPAIRNLIASLEGMHYMYHPVFVDDDDRTINLIERAITSLQSSGITGFQPSSASARSKYEREERMREEAVVSLLSVFDSKKLDMRRKALEGGNGSGGGDQGPSSSSGREGGRSGRGGGGGTPRYDKFQLTTMGRSEVRRGAYKCSPLDRIPVRGDPSDFRLTSYEFHHLARLTSWIARRLNSAYDLPSVAPESVPFVARMALKADNLGSTLFSPDLSETGVIAIDDYHYAVPDSHIRFELRWLASMSLWISVCVVVFFFYVLNWLLF